MNVDVCDCCGSELDDGSHFSIGKTWCRACWSGRRPAVSMPPTRAGNRAIAAWIAPRPPAQRMLPGVGLAQAQGASRG